MKRTTGSPKTSLIQDQPDSLRQLRLSKDIAVAINLAQDVDQAFEETCRLLIELTGWQSARGYILDSEPSQPPRLIVEWPRFAAEHDPKRNTRKVYTLPVPIKGATGAILEFSYTSSGGPGPKLVELLEEIARQLGIFIERQMDINQLQMREEFLRQLVESVKDFAFYTLDVDGRITSWNKGAEKIKGYQQHEVIGKHFTLFYTPQAIAENQPQIALEAARREGRYNSEDWRVRKDGSLFWADVVIFPIYNNAGILQGYTKLTRDLTKRKLIETELQETQVRHQIETAELRRRLMGAKEAERLNMAQELHDGPIQKLYGLIFGLDAIRSRIRSEIAQNQLQETKQQLQQVISRLRGMISELRPPTLAPFGLEKAIRSHLQDFREAHPELQIELDLDVDRRTLPEDVRLALYRVYQSSLANIVRHAEASQVLIRFKLEEEQILLEIRDNGKGFVVPERWIKLVREGHLGLVGARERAEAIGGTIVVESNPGEGTSVKVFVSRESIEPVEQDGSWRQS